MTSAAPSRVGIAGARFAAAFPSDERKGAEVELRELDELRL